MGSFAGAGAQTRPPLLFAALAAVAVIGLAGCSPRPVAVVNGQALSEQEFANLCETTVAQFPDQQSVGFQVLARWVQNTVHGQEAKKQAVYPSEKELNNHMDGIRRQMEFSGYKLDEYLKQRGQSLDAFRRQELEQLVAIKLICRGVSVSDEEVRREFEQRKPQLTMPEQVRISQITVEKKEDMDRTRSELAGNGDFRLVASTRSRDGFAANGGGVPEPLTLSMANQTGGPVAPQVIRAAFKLKEGQVSDPIKVGGTWVFVRVEEKKPKREPQLLDLAEFIREGLAQRKAQSTGSGRRNIQALTQAMRDAEVKVYRPELELAPAMIKQAAAAMAGAPGGPGGPGAPPVPGGPGVPGVPGEMPPGGP